MIYYWIDARQHGIYLLNTLYTSSYRISIISAFLCGRAAKKSNTLRVYAYFGDVRTRPYCLYVKNNLKKFSAANATAYAYRANEYTLEKKNNVLTSIGFSRRCWTIVRRNSPWDISILLMRSSCSERAKNMQFPSPWLSEIAKPFSNAVLCKVCDSLVLLDSMRASCRICWSARKMGSPVRGRRKSLK